MKKLSPELMAAFHQECVENNTYPDEAIDEVESNTDLLKNFEIAQEEHWGGEDQGSDYGSVYKLTDKETKEDYFVHFQGYYMSHNGTEWTEDYGGYVRQVIPVEVKKRDWEEVK